MNPPGHRNSLFFFSPFSSLYRRKGHRDRRSFLLSHLHFSALGKQIRSADPGMLALPFFGSREAVQVCSSFLFPYWLCKKKCPKGTSFFFLLLSVRTPVGIHADLRSSPPFLFLFFSISIPSYEIGAFPAGSEVAPLVLSFPPPRRVEPFFPLRLTS